MLRRWVLSFVVLTVVRAIAADDVVLAVADFETGDLSQLKRHQAEEDSITLVTEPVRKGRYAAKTWSRATDRLVAKQKRAEFLDRTARIEMNAAYRYELSILVPDTFVAPKKANAVLFQWHTQQDGPSPVLAIRVQGDEWLITSSVTGKFRVIARVPLKKGVWVDWAVDVRWAADATGYWTVTKDGVDVAKESSVVTQYPEALGPYVKFGQYHSVDEAPENIVYVDEYRVMKKAE